MVTNKSRVSYLNDSLADKYRLRFLGLASVCAPNITLQPSLKSGPDQSRLHTSRRLVVSRFSSRLNSAVRRGVRGRAKALVMEAIFYKAVISNSDLVFG